MYNFSCTSCRLAWTKAEEASANVGCFTFLNLSLHAQILCVLSELVHILLACLHTVATNGRSLHPYYFTQHNTENYGSK